MDLLQFSFRYLIIGLFVVLPFWFLVVLVWFWACASLFVFSALVGGLCLLFFVSSLVLLKESLSNSLLGPADLSKLFKTHLVPSYVVQNHRK